MENLQKNELTPLDYAEIAVEQAQEELNALQFSCQEIEASIRVIQDACVASEHRQMVLMELENYQESIEQQLDRTTAKVDAAEKNYEALKAKN